MSEHPQEETKIPTMRAAVFHGQGSPLAVESMSRPVPGPDGVLIKVAACGLCHTDLHYLDHGVATFKAPPIILGHEVSGTIEQVGEQVKDLAVGDRVLIPAVLTCGRCTSCREGRENICAHMAMLGNHMNGGYAEYIRVPGRDVFRLPKEVPLEEGCVIADALTTPYHAVMRRGRVTAGDAVLVLGCGGVGLGVVQMARAVGARVVAVDMVASKLELALKFGAVGVVDASSEKHVTKAVRKILGGNPEIAFEAIGRPETIAQAAAAVGAGGRVVLVGYCEHEVPLPAAKIMFRELDVIGSLGCRPVDYPRVIDLVRRGIIDLASMVSHRFSLERINEGLDMLRHGRLVRGIIVP